MRYIKTLCLLLRSRQIVTVIGFLWFFSFAKAKKRANYLQMSKGILTFASLFERKRTY